jgi:ABC-2 type transport system permease protein
MRMFANIFWLGTKELRSFFRDWVLLGLVTYSFSLAVMAQARAAPNWPSSSRSRAIL